MLGRKQPAAPSTPPPAPERVRTRPAVAAGEEDNSRIGKLRRQVRDIMSELRKVTWPNREETRNLTIVVIGITGIVGILLWALDILFSALYRLL